MRHFFLSFCIAFCISFFSLMLPSPGMAKTSDISAHFLETPDTSFPFDFRLLKLTSYLTRQKSPLVSSSQLIVYAADAYQIPWTLIVAIAGVESGFCQKIPHNSHNCWGWENGVHHFDTFEEAIITVSQTLRLKYYDRGLTTIERIAPVYAPPSLFWGKKVRYFTEKLESEFPSDSSYLQISL